MRIILLAAVLALTACAQAVPEPRFRAQEEVTLTDDAYGCQSIRDLQTVMGHRARGEYSAAAAVLARGNHWCFDRAGTEHAFTVFQVRGDAVQIGIGTIDQYRARDDWTEIDPLQQYWVQARHLVPVAAGDNGQR
ncbi:hypothetical protein [Coralloluteibacterium thermophilus]|uniref:Lipoprotein n=1 Tax=Coralloluteibacterium thermophilum TaxID=2707049 RepID=A0ABV9NLD8_9GAMM